MDEKRFVEIMDELGNNGVKYSTQVLESKDTNKGTEIKFGIGGEYSEKIQKGEIKPVLLMIDPNIIK